MKPLELLTMLRTVCGDTMIACQRQEFKTVVIHELHNRKMQHINNVIRNDSQLNGKVKEKFYREIRKVVLTPKRIKAYDLMQQELKTKVSTLSSAIEFMKR